MSNIKFSIIVPFLNEEKAIGLLLDSVAALKEQDSFELVMVDNNSTDGTVGIIESYRDKIKNLVLTKETRQGIGAARKAGARVAKGEIFVTADADVALSLDYLKTIGEAFGNSQNTVGVVGLYRFSDKSRLFNLLWRSWMVFFDFISRIITGTYAFRGLVSASRREAYFKAGEFNPTISALEDVELSLRLKKLGKIKYVPRMSVTTSYRRFRGRFIKQLIKRIKAYYYRAILRDNEAESDWETVR